jgi:MFS family permease
MLKGYSNQFWLLCLSTLLFFFSFSVLIPELPEYITTLGGEDYKGYIVGLFTIAAGLSRPISGKLADTVGRLPVMLFGGSVCILMSVLYPLFPFVFGFLVLRFFHGMSTGFMPTGSVAYLADIIPSDRRGEAMGLVGVMNNVGMMGGYALSSYITNSIGLTNLFWFSGLLAFLSVAIVFRMKETLPNPKSFRESNLKLKLSDVWDKRSMEPAVVILLTLIMFGAIVTLIPDYSIALGIKNKGLFMLIMTLATVATRLFTSKLSDKRGRVFSCRIGTTFWIIGALLMACRQIETFYAAAIVCGIASGINSPALFAWVVDNSKGIKAGRAMATLFIALEIGITIGSFLSAEIYDNKFSNLTNVFLIIGLINIITLFYLFFIVKNNRNLAL